MLFGTGEQLLAGGMLFDRLSTTSCFFNLREAGGGHGAGAGRLKKQLVVEDEGGRGRLRASLR